MHVGVCERCKKAQATFHLTDIKPSGEKVERHLCEKCATEEGLVQQPNVGLAEILSGLVSKQSSLSELSELQCPECGLTFLEFSRKGLLGCANDYQVFGQPLKKMLERAQDSATHHTGKSPRSVGSTRVVQQDIIRLRRQLDESVLAEDYERAADLRDRIAELEKQ